MIYVSYPSHEQLFLDTSNRWPMKSAAFLLDVLHMTNSFAKQKQEQLMKKEKNVNNPLYKINFEL